MAQLTARQWIQKLEAKLKALEQRNVPLEIAVRTTTAEQAVRIFQNGQNSSGRRIGSYSTRPRVISPRFAPRSFKADTFQPFNRAQRARTGKKGYYGKFFAQGYKQFRSEQGREAGFINLRLTNDLQSDFANVGMSKNTTSVASPRPIKVSTHIYKTSLKRQQNVLKREGLENRFGPIFRLTRKERDTFVRIAAFELRKILEA